MFSVPMNITKHVKTNLHLVFRKIWMLKTLPKRKSSFDLKLLWLSSFFFSYLNCLNCPLRNASISTFLLCIKGLFPCIRISFHKKTILFFLAIEIRQEGEVIIFQIHSQASLVWGSLLSCSMTLIKFKFPLYHL